MGKFWIRSGVIALAVAGCQVASGTAPPVPEATHTDAPPPPVSVARPSRACFHRPGRLHPLKPPTYRDGWRSTLSGLLAGTNISVSLALGDRLLFDHQGAVARIPASNQKLLLSMALLDAFPVSSRIPTSAAARIDGPSIAGDLFVYGLGDPTFGDAAYRATLGLTGSTIDRLARQVAALGFEKVEGRVVGLRGALLGDWDAVGWRTKVARRYIARPTALSVNGNRASATAPERQAAAALTARLEELGVDVAGAPGRSTQPFPRRASSLGGVTSPPLIELIGIMARDSSNFIAEVLSKRLGAKCFGPPGTIASGARAITRWARMNGASIVANDASGLSYDNQISTRAMVGLMTQVRKRWWGGQLMRALPEPGQGTLAHRLEGLTMHAKTGSLFDGTSTLSGWVWLEREQHWAAFSIMSSLGDAGPALEDEIVRLVARTAAL